jgi:hypothetical protein
MNNTYALVITPDNEVNTLRLANVDQEDTKVGMHNLIEWLDSTQMGRFEFAPSKCLWFAPVDDTLNLVGVGLMGNRVVIRGNVVITTWEKRGPESEGIPERDIPELWTWIEEIVTYNKMYADTHDMTLEQLRTFVEQEINK